MKKVSKKIKEGAISPALKQEFRNLGALIENNNHRIEAIGEQYLGLNGKVEILTENVEFLAEKVEILTEKLDVVEQVGEILVRTTNLEADMSIVKSDVSIIKNDLNRKVDIENFEKHDRRISFLEKRVAR